MLSAILDTVGALVVVLDPRGPDRAVQPRLRADYRLFVRGSEGEADLGSLPGARRSADRFRALSADQLERVSERRI